MESNQATEYLRSKGYGFTKQIQNFKQRRFGCRRVAGLPKKLLRKIRKIIRKIPEEEWETIKSSYGSCRQIHDFMNNHQRKIAHLRLLIIQEYILFIQKHFQDEYFSLSWYEFNILGTLAGKSVDQGIHIDVKKGVYALSVIVAIAAFRFFHCENGKKRHVFWGLRSRRSRDQLSSRNLSGVYLLHSKTRLSTRQRDLLSWSKSSRCAEWLPFTHEARTPAEAAWEDYFTRKILYNQ